MSYIHSTLAGMDNAPLKSASRLQGFLDCIGFVNAQQSAAMPPVGDCFKAVIKWTDNFVSAQGSMAEYASIQLEALPPCPVPNLFTPPAPFEPISGLSTGYYGNYISTWTKAIRLLENAAVSAALSPGEFPNPCVTDTNNQGTAAVASACHVVQTVRVSVRAFGPPWEEPLVP